MTAPQDCCGQCGLPVDDCICAPTPRRPAEPLADAWKRMAEHVEIAEEGIGGVVKIVVPLP